MKMGFKCGKPVMCLSEKSVYLYMRVSILMYMCVNKDAIYILD